MAAKSLSQSSRAALYARVSTTNGQQDPEMQLRELREYAQRRGFTVFGEYADRISGTEERRPHLDRLLSDCRKRYVDIVVVFKRVVGQVRFEKQSEQSGRLQNWRTIGDVTSLFACWAKVNESWDGQVKLCAPFPTPAARPRKIPR